MDKMRKIAIAMSKGGVGKTTTAVNLAAGLAGQGLPVLLIDTDTQGQAARALGVSPAVGLAELMAGQAEPAEAVMLARERLYLLSGGAALAGTKREIARAEFGGERLLSQALAMFEGRVAYVILDTGPGWDSLLVNVLFYANELLCPVNLEGLAIQGLADFYKRVQAVREFRADLVIKYILPTALDRRVSQSGEILQQLEGSFSQWLLPAIPYNVRLSEAATRGQTIWEYAPDSAGAEAYSRLVDTIAAGGAGWGMGG
jgi:chromosome partitioning protein